MCFLIVRDGQGKKRCGLQFPSENKLKEHKKLVGHLLRKRKAKDSNIATPMKQIRIEDVGAFQISRANTENNDDDAINSEIDQEEEISRYVSRFLCSREF